MPNNTDYLDIESALKRVGGNETLYKKLLKLFLADNNVEDLCNAIETGSCEDIARFAHTIKGVGANLSFTKMRTIAADIEVQAKEGNDCKEYLPELRESFEKTLELINEYMG